MSSLVGRAQNRVQQMRVSNHRALATLFRHGLKALGAPISELVAATLGSAQLQVYSEQRVAKKQSSGQL